MNHDFSNIEVIIEKNYENALVLASSGYLPIEASYGQQTLHDISRQSELMTLDHHGVFEDLECPAKRAQTSFLGQGTGKYVLSHIDNDSVLTILGLEGVRIPLDFIDKVAQVDVNGLHIIPEEEIYSIDYVKLRMMSSACHEFDGWQNISILLERIIEILEQKDTTSEILAFIANEQQRREAILKDTTFLMNNNVGVLVSAEYGFDVVYAKCPIVIGFDLNKKCITIGCRDQDVATKFFGAEGLQKLFKLLGKGWGGRTAIGGSPRGEQMTGEDLVKVIEKTRLLLDNRNLAGQRANFDIRYLDVLRQELAVLGFLEEIK